MPPSVDLSPSVFARLQAHAEPLVDDTESVISRLLDHCEILLSTRASTSERVTVSNVDVRDPQPSGDLTYSRLSAVDICGTPLERSKVNWYGLLVATIREARARLSPSEFRKLVTTNFVEDKKNDKGFVFFPDMGISIQQRDANTSWKAAHHIAQALGFSIEVHFVSRDGTPGRLYVGPDK